MKHTFQCHSSLPMFKFTCGLSGCIQTFRTYSAMASHLVRKHSNFDLTQVNNEPLLPLEAGSGDSNEFESGDGDMISEEFESGDREGDMVLEEPAKRNSALLLLTLKERHRLTQKAVDFSVCQVKVMLAHVLDEVKAKVKQRVGEIDIEDCFDVDPFEGLSTEYFQTKFYREYFDLVVSSCLYPI